MSGPGFYILASIFPLKDPFEKGIFIKTKQLVIGTSQKLSHPGNPCPNLFLCGTPVGEANDEKRLGVKIDKHLS